MKTILTSAFITLSIFMLIYFLSIYTFIPRSEYSHMKDACEYYDSTYLSKSGWSEKYGSYQLKSFNGGEDWYNIVDDSITGFADPKLLRNLQAWDIISKFVKENGAIDLQNFYLFKPELNEVGIFIDDPTQKYTTEEK